MLTLQLNAINDKTSVYTTCYRRHAMTGTSKTAKIIKG